VTHDPIDELEDNHLPIMAFSFDYKHYGLVLIGLIMNKLILSCLCWYVDHCSLMSIPDKLCDSASFVVFLR